MKLAKLTEATLRDCYALRKAGWDVSQETEDGGDFHGLLCKMARDRLEAEMGSTFSYDVNDFLTLGVVNGAKAADVVAAARLLGLLEEDGGER